MAVKAKDQVTLAVLPSPSYVRLYYLKQASTLSPPAKPTTNPPPSTWKTDEPVYTAGSTDTLYTVMLTAYGSVTFEYGPVQKSSSFEAAKQAYNKAVSAETAAGEALSLANLAEQLADGMVWVGPEEPPHELRVEGQVWIETDTFDGEDGPEERMVAIRSLEDPEPSTAVWQTYTTITGLLIVPGEDGIPTIIDQSGITVGTAMAESIGVGALAADSVGAKQIILGEVKKNHLDPHLEGVLDDAEDLAERVVILPSSITISRSRVGGSGPLTALRLEADRLSFIVDDEPAAYINASTRVMHIDNAIFTESVQIGEHQVRKLGDQGITIFTWNGGA